MKNIILAMLIGGLLYSAQDFKWLEQNPKNFGDKGIVIVPDPIGGIHLGTLYYYEYKQKCGGNESETLNIISGDGCWEMRQFVEIKDYGNNEFKDEDMIGPK
jgi:hypothetical protein